MQKKYEFSGAEIEYMRKVFSLTLPFDGIDDFAELIDEKKDEYLKEAEKRLKQDGWIREVESGKMEADKEILELFRICGSFDIAVGIEEGKQGGSDRNIYFFAKGSQMTRVEDGATWSLEGCERADLQAYVKNTIIWDEIDELNNTQVDSNNIIIKSDILEDFKARNQFAFDTTWNVPELMRLGLSKGTAKLTSDALAEKLTYHHIWCVDALGKSEPKSLTALYGKEGSIMINPTLSEGEDAVEISAISKAMYLQVIEDLFNKKEGVA